MQKINKTNKYYSKKVFNKLNKTENNYVNRIIF
jgi:hypothetical protein